MLLPLTFEVEQGHRAASVGLNSLSCPHLLDLGTRCPRLVTLLRQNALHRRKNGRQETDQACQNKPALAAPEIGAAANTSPVEGLTSSLTAPLQASTNSPPTKFFTSFVTCTSN